MDKLWSFRSRLDIPLAHITNVEADPSQAGRWWRGLKMLGADLPGVFAAGTFLHRDGIVFWDVRHPESTIIVSLEHEFYKKLIVDVAEPSETVAQLRSALGALNVHDPERQ
jgi:hypothetical protein